MLEVLGYAFIAIVVTVIGYVFFKLFSAGLSAVTHNDD